MNFCKHYHNACRQLYFIKQFYSITHALPGSSYIHITYFPCVNNQVKDTIKFHNYLLVHEAKLMLAIDGQRMSQTLVSYGNWIFLLSLLIFIFVMSYHLSKPHYNTPIHQNYLSCLAFSWQPLFFVNCSGSTTLPGHSSI
jgi:hypothetical protein